VTSDEALKKGKLCFQLVLVVVLLLFVLLLVVLHLCPFARELLQVELSLCPFARELLLVLFHNLCPFARDLLVDQNSLCPLTRVALQHQSLRKMKYPFARVLPQTNGCFYDESITV